MKREPKYPIAAKGHMPFQGHRTQEQVREDEEYWQRVYEREARRP